MIRIATGASSLRKNINLPRKISAPLTLLGRLCLLPLSYVTDRICHLRLIRLIEDGLIGGFCIGSQRYFYFRSTARSFLTPVFYPDTEADANADANTEHDYNSTNAEGSSSSNTPIAGVSVKTTFRVRSTVIAIVASAFLTLPTATVVCRKNLGRVCLRPNADFAL